MLRERAKYRAIEETESLVKTQKIVANNVWNMNQNIRFQRLGEIQCFLNGIIRTLTSSLRKKVYFDKIRQGTLIVVYIKRTFKIRSKFHTLEEIVISILNGIEHLVGGKVRIVDIRLVLNVILIKCCTFIVPFLTFWIVYITSLYHDQPSLQTYLS